MVFQLNLVLLMKFRYDNCTKNRKTWNFAHKIIIIKLYNNFQIYILWVWWMDCKVKFMSIKISNINRVILELKGIGSIPKENIFSRFFEKGFEVKIHEY